MNSIIPSREQLEAEYERHAEKYEHYPDDYSSRDESREFYYHKNEADKLLRVLNALYPGWRKAGSVPVPELCIACRKNPPVKGHSTCAECVDWFSSRVAERGK